MHQFIAQERDDSSRRNIATMALVLVLLVTLLLLATPAPAYACSCAPPPSPSLERDRADAVFSGTALDVDTFALPLLDQSGLPVRVTFEVNGVWKGDLSQRVVVRTARDEAACGYDFTVGKDYLVYARKGEDGLVTGLCDRTTARGNAAEDLAALGAPEPPLTVNEGSPVWLRITLGGLLFFLAMAGVLAFAILRGRRAARAEPL